MRACAAASAVFLGLVFSTMTFLACSSGPASGTGKPPPGPDNATPSSDGTGAAATPAATSKPVAPKDDREIAHCKEVLASSMDPLPDGGVVMNNAMTSADAGSSDRFKPTYELLATKKEGFRCCFGIWGTKNPGQPGKIGLKVELKPDGTVTNIALDPSRTDVHDPKVEDCVIELAKTLSFPVSPSGKITTFTYPYVFKPFK